MEVIFLFIAGFLAGFIDAIVGGGGLVQAPALFVMYPSWTVPQVIATTRIASFVGTSVAAYQYAQKVVLDWRTIIWAGIGTSIFAYIGAQFSYLMPTQVMKPVVLILMFLIAVYTYMKKNFGEHEQIKISQDKIWIYALVIGMVMGFYNGVVGPGTGSLLVFGFVGLMGYGFLSGSAISKFVNVIADLGSLIFFVINGVVNYEVGVILLVANVLGSYFGSRLAILKGNRFVRIFFLVVVFGLIIRFGYDILKP